MEKNKSTLGKGLGALLGDAEYTVISPHSAARVKSDVSGYIRIDLIEVNPFQPRSDFDQETLE